MEKCENSLRDLREDIIKQNNIHIIGIAEGKKERGAES